VIYVEGNLQIRKLRMHKKGCFHSLPSPKRRKPGYFVAKLMDKGMREGRALVRIPGPRCLSPNVIPFVLVDCDHRSLMIVTEFAQHEWLYFISQGTVSKSRITHEF
jgi:hypothetical protein